MPSSPGHLALNDDILLLARLRAADTLGLVQPALATGLDGQEHDCVGRCVSCHVAVTVRSATTC